MSWYTDPQLFIFSDGYSLFEVYRFTKEFGVLPILYNDAINLDGPLSFSKHLSLGYNKESDFDAFKATIGPKFGNEKFTNSHGSVIYWNIATQRGTWSVEEPNSPFWSLPGITKHKSVTELLADNQALAEQNFELKAKNASLQDEVDNKVKKEAIIGKRVSDLEEEISILRAEVNKEKAEKSSIISGLKREDMLGGLEALEKQVLDLTSKLAQYCGATGAGSSPKKSWSTGEAVPSNWVPIEELDVLAYSRSTPLTITKAAGGSKFGDDNTTNVQADCFYGGIFPIVIVDVAELTPNRKEARFDPCVWGSYNNAGINYAARKPFALEISGSNLKLV